MCQASRESIMYQASVFQKDLPQIISTLSQMATKPLFMPQEVQEAQDTMLWEIENRQFNTDESLPEKLHSVAYGAAYGDSVNTLGRPLYNSQESLLRLNSDVLTKFHSEWFTPNRMVVTGVGMEHDQLVDLVNESLGSLPALPQELLDLQAKRSHKPLYTGGCSITDTTLHATHPNPEHFPLTHLQIAFEAFSSSDPDIYALATFVSLMGGGGSFSAGGPGKGMYTRIYTSVLNRYGWIESCHAVHHSYSDSSLFTITAAVPPSDGAHTHISDVVCDQLMSMTEYVTGEELSRAKNQLKSSLLMALESRIVEAEDIGRQYLACNHRLNVLEVCRRIDSLTVHDLRRVARRVLLGSNEASPLDFGDPMMKPWTRTGHGQPTILVWGPLLRNDALYKVEDTLKKWGLGNYAASSKEPSLKRNWMGRLRQ